MKNCKYKYQNKITTKRKERKERKERKKEISVYWS